MKRIFILLYVLPILSYAQNPPQGHKVNDKPVYVPQAYELDIPVDEKFGKIDIKDLNLDAVNNPGSEPESEPVSDSVSDSKSDYEFAHDMAAISKQYNYETRGDGSGFTYDRFAKSPCFSKLGFSPNINRIDLDKEYCDCEREYWTGKIGVGLIILLLLGGVAYMIWLSRGGGKIKLWKKTSNKTTTE